MYGHVYGRVHETYVRKRPWTRVWTCARACVSTWTCDGMHRQSTIGARHASSIHELRTAFEKPVIDVLDTDLHTCPYTCLCTRLCMSIHVPVKMSVHMAIHMCVHKSVTKPANTSVHMAVYISMHRSVHMAVCVCMYVRVCVRA